MNPDASSTHRVRRRVLVVDDSAFMRRLVSEVVQASGEFEVVGTARDGEDALRQVAALDPDLVTLDVDMPALDGLSALRRIMRECPRPVVMLSAGGSDGGADATLKALEAGAVEFVRKPSGAISLDLDVVGDRLLDALRAAAHAQLLAITPESDADAPSSSLATTDGARDSTTDRATDGETGDRADPRRALQAPPQFVVVVAASTGGPAALAQVVPALPAWTDVAIVVVQHMPAGFTERFARRLHGASRLTVQEAVHGMPLRGGAVYIAPGGVHCAVTGALTAPCFALAPDPPLWGVRPAADPLFASAARLFGARTIGVVLTGMGCDGAAGLAAVRDAGGLGIVQDRASCIVDGMPEAARRLAGADIVAPLSAIAGALGTAVERLRQHRAA